MTPRVSHTHAHSRQHKPTLINPNQPNPSKPTNQPASQPPNQPTTLMCGVFVFSAVSARSSTNHQPPTTNHQPPVLCKGSDVRPGVAGSAPLCGSGVICVAFEGPDAASWTAQTHKASSTRPAPSRTAGAGPNPLPGSHRQRAFRPRKLGRLQGRRIHGPWAIKFTQARCHGFRRAQRRQRLQHNSL